MTIVSAFLQIDKKFEIRKFRPSFFVKDLFREIKKIRAVFVGCQVQICKNNECIIMRISYFCNLRIR